VFNDAVGVDDKHASKGAAFVFEKDTVGSAHLMVLIGEEGNVYLIQTALMPWSLSPLK